MAFIASRSFTVLYSKFLIFGLRSNEIVVTDCRQTVTGVGEFHILEDFALNNSENKIFDEYFVLSVTDESRIAFEEDVDWLTKTHFLIGKKTSIRPSK